MSKQVSFSVSDGVLTISSDDEPETWIGLPDGMRVLDLRGAPDEHSVFVLLDPPAGNGRVRNLVRIADTGEVVWRGVLPEAGPTDSFVSLELGANGDVLASTWTGNRVRLDPGTGQLLGYSFTK